jgi:TP901-1 family phage major tail protein
MAAQKGKDLLLKIESDTPGSFQTIAGLRSRALAFNAATVDITHTESVGHWRELLTGAGIRSARISGAGVFKDAQSDELMRATFFAAAVRTWQVVVPDFGIIEGPFQIATLEIAGSHDREVTFDLVLESAGALQFTAI